MRVLLLTSQFAPEVGGVPRLLWQFCEHCPEHVELRVLAVRQRDRMFYEDFDRRSPIPIERVAPLPGAGLTSARVAARLAAILGHWRPDVLLCGVAYPTAILARAVTSVRPVPYVVYTHSEDATIANPLKRLALSDALRHAEGLIAVSDFTRREMAGLGAPPGRVTIIHPGIDLERFANPARLAPLEALRGRWVMLTVARLVRRKGFDTVIRALPHILERVPNAHYVMVGGGPDEGYFRSLVRELGVGDQVTFAGRVDDVLLPAFYHACDTYIMPTRPSEDGSEVEGFGIVYLEAAAAGKPAIGGRAGGVADAIIHGETGLLVDPLNVEQVAEAAIRLALDRSLAEKMGRAALARVQREGSAAAFAARVVGLLEQARRKDRLRRDPASEQSGAMS